MPDAKTNLPRWDCLRLARRHDPNRRVPLHIDGVVVGSVARVHLPALDGEGALHVDALGVHLHHTLRDAGARTRALTALNQRLRAAGLIHGWRDEPYAVRPLASTGLDGAGDARSGVLAVIERASSRFWGTLTLGAHATGYVADGTGRPTDVWIARRSLRKATDPGRLDNLVGGGVPHGQSPFEALVREGWEEAGLPASRMRAAVAGRIMRLLTDLQEGLQAEVLHSHDLRLRHDEVPVNQDGEVASFQRLPVAQALEHAAGGDMTTDAALVMLDFALRHQLIAPAEATPLRAALDGLV